MAQIYLAHGKIYMSHRYSCVPLVASGKAERKEITEKTLSPSRDGLVTVLITMLLKVESSILLSPIQCILLHQLTL